MKFKIAKLEDAPEALRGYYVLNNADGQYYLNVEGAVAKERLDEFRNNNVELTKKLEAYKDIDPSKVQTLLDTERKVQEKKLIDAGDVEGLVGLRVGTMKSEYEGQINDLSGKLTTAQRQLEVLLIDNEVRAVAIKAGVQPTAVDDVLLRAKTTFKVEEGRPVAKNEKGELIYSKDGVNPLGIGDWLGGLKDQAPHLFQQSTGSGTQHNGRPNPSGNQNLSPAQKISAGLASGNSIAIQN